MKIALVCPASLPATQFGGILFLCVDIARELSKTGHDVTIYTTDLDSANNAKTFNKSLPRLETIHGFKINRTHVWFALQLFYVNPGIYAQIKNDKPDVIHTIGARSFQSFIAALVSKKLNIPLVVSDQGGLTTHPDLQANLLKKIFYMLQDPMLKFVINQATRISVANEYEKKIFLQFCDESKIAVVRNGISLDELNSINVNFKQKYGISEKFVLFVGRFNTVKGIDTLIKAWASIANEIRDRHTRLVIMGVDFGFEKKMLDMIRELNIVDVITVIKKPPRQDVISAYGESEFLALPSRWELSPLTPLEGFAFHKPVISTTAHGIPYTVVDGENAILVESENQKELANAILKLLDDDKTRLNYGESGYKLIVNTCNSNKMAEKTLEIYKEAINR